MYTIEESIKKIVEETVFSTYEERIATLEANDHTFVTIVKVLNEQLNKSKETIVTLKRELADVKGMLQTRNMQNNTLVNTLNESISNNATLFHDLETSNTRNAQLTRDLETSNTRNTQLTRNLETNNSTLIESGLQNFRLKKRERTYMKYEDKLEIIMNHIQRWDGDIFYVLVSDMKVAFEHAAKPVSEFTRTLKNRGYDVTRCQYNDQVQYKCFHPKLTRQDIATQVHLSKKKRMNETMEEELQFLEEDMQWNRQDSTNSLLMEIFD